MSKKLANRWNLIFYFAYNDTQDDDFFRLRHCNRNYDETTFRNFIEHTLNLKQKLVILNIHTNRSSFISKMKIESKLKRFKQFYEITKGMEENYMISTVLDIFKKLPRDCFIITRKSNTQKLLEGIE